MSFTQSSSNITVGPGPSGTGAFLQATCCNENGDWIQSEPLDLDRYFGNINGELKLGEHDFSQSAEKVELSNEGSTLVAWLMDGSGGVAIASVDLDGLVANENGKLVIKM